MLAEEACRVEIDILGHPIGRQDQYATAFGGLRMIGFDKQGITVEDAGIPPGIQKEFQDSLLLFYTGRNRIASNILAEQKRNIGQKMAVLVELKQLAFEARSVVHQGDFKEFGEILHQGWLLKQTLASGISYPEIDDVYERARQAGAWGGKIAGAGGGGFLLLCCESDRKKDVREALSGMRELKVSFQEQGSRIILDYPEDE